jgi:REP element-mobilizing transposase RayT
VTRRCSERRFFLRPSDETNELFLYLLAVAVDRFGILLHSFVVLSNHYHFVLTDPRGVLPRFHQFLDSLVARAVNAAIGHQEAFWDRESYSFIQLETAEDVLAKVVYVLANPVAAGLVRNGHEWPGLWSDPRRIGGEPITIHRPERFFRSLGPLPESVQLRLHPPPGFEDDPSFVATVAQALEAKQDRIASNHGRAGRAFLGRAGALAQKWWASPARAEPFGRLNPRVAGRRKSVRADAMDRLRGFWDAYREALTAWRTGMRDVLFPPGTWAMRVHHGARCEAAS